ncbi:NusA N-terminal domain-containing protein [Mycoplasmopsis gallinacea]|uniref:Transcription termination/antitermination protein NusA n=1 Tax=Mycoplasmopsis gallinacea TaxID=29556 RepID=A0A6H0V4I5_9BACT|nr:NusA N-terminal domain-containing protein [Mycoplasmopsis gallinacea]QIW61893.1 transcription termination/antitermination protein NusA [Mycoplasmopsis gallinacea]
MSKIQNDLLNPNPNRDSEFYQVIEGFARNNKLEFKEILEIFESEINKTIAKNIDPEVEVQLVEDAENKKVYIYNVNGSVVEDSYEFDDEEKINGDEAFELDPTRISFIKLSEARDLYGKKLEVDDVVSIKFSLEALPEKSRNAIMSGFNMSLRAQIKLKTYEAYKDLIGSKLSAKILSKYKNGSFNLEFEDGVTAFLFKNKVNTKSKMELGSYIDVYLENINLENKLSICEVTMISPKEIEDAIKREIPEIANGDILIVKIQRNVGIKSKIAVQPNPERSFDYDVISSIFGEGARRILAVSQSLNGEKIDIVRYSDNKEEYIKYALSPAKVIDVLYQKGTNTYLAIVQPEEVVSAIGREGNNINLAAKLVGAKIEVKSTEDAIKDGIEFNKSNMYEKPLFKATAKNDRTKKARSQYFDNIEIDLQDFKADVQNFMESFTDELVNEPVKEVKAKPKAQTKLNENEIENWFSPENIQIEVEDEDEYDFIEQIDFEELLTKEEEETEAKAETAQEAPTAKKPVEKYKKAKVELKGFKVDNDLANYGLDGNLDLREFEDEWDE